MTRQWRNVTGPLKNALDDGRHVLLGDQFDKINQVTCNVGFVILESPSVFGHED